MTSLFDEYLGEQLERIHVTPEGLGDYKSITFSFANGRSLILDVELHSRKDAIYPAIRATTGKWEMIKAAPEDLPTTPQDIPMPEVKGPAPGIGETLITHLGHGEPVEKEPNESEIDTNITGPSQQDRKMWRLLNGQPIDHIPDCAIYNNPPKGFASSVSDCDCGVAERRLRNYNQTSSSLDEVDVCPISGQPDCNSCRVDEDCDHKWAKHCKFCKPRVEGKVRKGGTKPEPSTPKPDVKPVGQKPKHFLEVLTPVEHRMLRIMRKYRFYFDVDVKPAGQKPMGCPLSGNASILEKEKVNHAVRWPRLKWPRYKWMGYGAGPCDIGGGR